MEKHAPLLATHDVYLLLCMFILHASATPSAEMRLGPDTDGTYGRNDG
jgi:hypothetical protein